MSYDIGLEYHAIIETENGEKEERIFQIEETERNITFNLKDMFIALIGTPPKEWIGKRASEMRIIFLKACIELYKNPEKYVQYEAENGWGTIEGMKSFLTYMENSCDKHPNAFIYVDM